MSFRSKLIGAWELVEFAAVNKDDEKDVFHPMGENCLGMIMYTPDGYMSAHLNAKTTPLYTTSAVHGTAEERAEVAEGTTAYSGPFYLQESEGNGPHNLYHEMKVSIPRNWIGGVQGRPARIVEEDGEMFLCLSGQPIDMGDGKLRSARVKWRRAKDNSQGKLPVRS